MTRSGRWVDPFAGVPGRRLFVAVPLSASAAAEIASVVDEVRADELPQGTRDVRWVRLDGLHLTLRFLGPTPEDRVDPTWQAVVRAANATAPIDADLVGAGTFPPGGRPRALWIGVATRTEALADLARLVHAELETAGWPPDDRPFRAHLTLARSDGVGVGRLVADRLVAAMEGRRIPLRIDRLVLFESVTGGGPARYVPVGETGLVGAP